MNMKTKNLLLCAFAAALSLTLTLPARAQKLSDRVRLSIDRPDGRYASGEKIDVYVESDAELDLPMQVFLNGNVQKKLCVASKHIPAGKSLLYSASYDAPTAQVIRLLDPEKKGEFADIGAIVDAEGFRPGFACPADMRAFWDKEIKAMRKMKMKAKLTKVEIPADKVKKAENIECFAFEINCVGDVPARGYLAKPKDAEPGSLPILVYLHGAGVAKTGNRSSITLAANYAKRGGGAIVVDLNAHGMLSDQPQSYYDDLDANALKNYSRREPVDHQSFYFRTMFLRAQRTLDYLCTLPEWDGERVLVMGSSQGGAQTAALAGMDPRVKVAVLTVPAMMDMGGKLAGRASGWPKLLELYKTSETAAQILPYYDGVNFLQMTDARLFMETGLSDFTCPPADVFAGFNVAKSADKVIYTNPYRAHSDSRNYPPGKRDEWKKNIDDVRFRFINDYLK